ncbi:hypothetical protein HLB23_09375 [Nocardia uniformis]|uniref:DUF4190 domain-containing protein n=1 Tax=Nocardia uniformis TaxID=53432 RepID=A0A849C2K3_9NOCA|nr:hypothetical protein [Nocardia uniformis]NNH70067.1 hypothetical protein [Nocardia uniformis]
MSTPPNDPNEPRSGSESGGMFEKRKDSTPSADQDVTPSAGQDTAPSGQGTSDPGQAVPPPGRIPPPGAYPQPGEGFPPPGQGAPPQYPAGGVYNYPAGASQQQSGFPPYPQQPYGQPPAGHPGYGQQYQPYPSGYGAPPQQRGTQVFSIIGFVCAAVALLFCPPGFGIAGIVLGLIGNSKGEPLGKWAALAAGICMVIGLVIGFLLVGANEFMTD